MLTSSGQAANFYAIFNIASCGDHIVASSTIYGGTFNLFLSYHEAHGHRLYFRKSRLHRGRT